MTDEKAFQREVTAVWDRLRRERRERRKLTNAVDLTQSAQIVSGLAKALSDLAKRAEAPTTDAAAAPKPAKKRKAKKSPKRKSKTKAAPTD